MAVILVLTDDAGNVVGIEKRLNTKSTSILTEVVGHYQYGGTFGTSVEASNFVWASTIRQSPALTTEQKDDIIRFLWTQRRVGDAVQQTTFRPALYETVVNDQGEALRTAGVLPPGFIIGTNGVPVYAGPGAPSGIIGFTRVGDVPAPTRPLIPTFVDP